MGINQNPLQGHWDFSLALYARPGVEAACLTLQDNIHVDVNVLLVSLYWAGKLRRTLEVDQLRVADEEVEAWRRNVVIPLRALRVGLKSGPPPAPNEDTEVLRKMIKAAELQAERTAQETLSAWFSLLAGSPGAEHIPQAIATTANNVVEYYLKRSSVPIASTADTPVDGRQESPSIQIAKRASIEQDIGAATELIWREAASIYAADSI